MRPVGLGTRMAALFASGALAVSAALAVATFELNRHFLVAERQLAGVRSAYLDARIVASGVAGGSGHVAEVLRTLDTGTTRRPVVRLNGQWYARNADDGLTRAIPPALQTMVARAVPASQLVRLNGDPLLVVGVPLPEAGGGYFEVTNLAELDRTLRLLALTLAGVAAATTLAGAALGWRASRRLMRPLAEVAGVARRITAGDVRARAPGNRDPDLAAVGSAFNAMVDELARRAERDRRFAADVSHELRSPLQTLSAVASVLAGRRDSLDQRTAGAVDLLTHEVSRFETLATDLLELARSDRAAERRATDVAELARSVVAERGHDPGLVEPPGPVVATVDPRRVRQILANLVDNADRHAGGVVRVGLVAGPATLRIEVDDHGPGVAPEDRELIFDRFARGRAAGSRAEGSGTGLGLALVAQHAAAHGGTALVDEAPGGARFTVELPVPP